MDRGNWWQNVLHFLILVMLSNMYLPLHGTPSFPSCIHSPQRIQGDLPKYKSAHLTALLTVLQRFSITLTIKPHSCLLASYDLAPQCSQISAPSILFLTETYFPSYYFPNTLCSFYLGSFVLAVLYSFRDRDYHGPSGLRLNATFSERPSLSTHPVIHSVY